MASGLYSLSLPKVAAETGFSVGTVRNYFGSIDGLRSDVLVIAGAAGNKAMAREQRLADQYGSPEKIKAAAAK